MRTTIIGSNSNTAIESQVDNSFQALRMSVRPLEFNIAGQNLGHFRANLITGTTVSLAANAPIASFRWTDSKSYAVILSITATANVNATITTGTVVDLEAILARGFTVSDTAGTAVVPSSGLKSRNNMGNSLIGDLRIATTTTLTAGTRTLDTVGFGFACFGLGLTTSGANSAMGVKVYQWDTLGQHPIIIAFNEGFILRVPTAGPVTGGIRYGITIDWAEVPTF